jgi:hypothetical protein
MQTRLIMAAAVLALAAPSALAANELLGVDAQIAGPLGPLLGEPRTVGCGGTGTSSCSDGTHIVVGLVSIPIPGFGQGHGFRDYSGFTGTATSHLKWTTPQGQSGERVFGCTFLAGVLTSCPTRSGTFPPDGVDMVTHTCDAVGVGSWGCYYTFTGVDSPV